MAAAGDFLQRESDFLIVGVVMLVVGGRDLMKKDKAKQCSRSRSTGADARRQPEPAEEKKSMSIAQRAHLADGLDE